MEKDQLIGYRMTVAELIAELQKFPMDMGVILDKSFGVHSVSKCTISHTNYPYNLPDCDYVNIE